jgi:signal transduction histidine kinase
VKRISTSIRSQLIIVTVAALIVLALALGVIDYFTQRGVLINSERRVGLTLISAVNNTINTVRPFIRTLSDIAELDTRLAELVELNDNIDFIAITDDSGFAIFHSDDTYQGQSIAALTELPTEATVQRGVPGFNDVFLTSLPFDSSDLTEPKQFWIIIASASEPISNQLTNGLLSSLLVTALFASLTAVLLVSFLQQYFVRPLEELTRAAGEIEHGNLSNQVEITQNNEIGQLAGSFNRMTQQLAHSINTLEVRVKERTHDLEIARDQAEQANRVKSDFLSNMSHELRTPLNMVIGYTSSMLNMPQMYKNIPLPEVFRNDIQLIRESGKHLLALINDVLDLSKVEAGRLELNLAPVDLNQTLDGVIAASLGLLGEKPVQIRQQYPSDLPKIWADPIRIRQILLNLLSNAIKYTDTGSVTVIAEVQGQEVYVAVRDTGRGIPKESISTIFDRFQQLQQSAEIQGTGLGLDISQRLAQLHGTKIEIESEVGVGSTFSFHIAAATQEQLALAVPDERKSYNVQVFAGNSQFKTTAVILAADAILRKTLRQNLELNGSVVVEANAADEVFDLLTGLLPDFVLIDADSEQQHIPRILEQMQSDSETQSIPLIVIQSSGLITTYPVDAVQAVIKKPLSSQKVGEALQGLLQQPT